MSDDVLSLVKAAQKERAELTRKLATLKQRESATRAQRKTVEERIAHIDEAFAPLKATLAGVGVAAPVAPRRPDTTAPEFRAGSQMAALVTAIGGFGFREFTTSEIVAVTDLPIQNIYAMLSQLVGHGRIKRIEPGKYRAIVAQIVGDGAA